MNRIFLIVALVIIFFHGSLFGQTTGTGEAATEETHTYRSLTLAGGYRFIDLSGSAQVGEYEYFHNSVVLEGDMPLIILPHRIHLDIIVNNGKDYAGDISYAYKDIVSFRGISALLYHNLNNIQLIDLDPSTASPGVDVRDAGEEYGIKTGLSSFFLRLKTPDFPLHIYVEGDLIEKDGKQQQRFMGGAAYFTEMVRVSRSMDVNWKTEDIVIGANSHLGPVEIDLSHGEKKFRSSGDDILYDSYSAADTTRNAGVYPHNLIPDQKGSTNTIKLHTSYTGRLVASATLSDIKRENSESEARADYVTGTGEVTWMPVDKLTFFFKYRYNDRDVDNPENVTITDASNPLNKYTYNVRPSISSVSNTFSGTARYRALKDLTLKAKFSYDDIHRRDAEDWDLPERTTTKTASATADLKIKKNLKLRAAFTHKATNSPATNVEPDIYDSGEISVSWMPTQKINTFLGYCIKDGEREELHYMDTKAADKRYANQKRLLGSITFLPLKDFSLTASYFYLNDKTQQDIEYHDTAGIPNIDPYVPYKNISHNYSIYAMYIPVKRINLHAGVNHTRSNGGFHVEDINLTQPVSIDSFSELKTKMTVYSMLGEYMYKENSSLSLEYIYGDLEDILDNPYDDVEDGMAHMIILTFLKKW